MESCTIWPNVDELAFHEDALIIEALARSQAKDLNSEIKGEKKYGPDVVWARDFLDDFALFAAGPGQASNVTAACLESSHIDDSLIIRVAKNEDFDFEVRMRLSQVVDLVNQVMQAGLSPSEGEERCFDLIVQNCRARIMKQVTGLKGLWSLIHDCDILANDVHRKLKYSCVITHSEAREDTEKIGEYNIDTHREYMSLAQSRWTEITQIVDELKVSSDLENIKSLARVAYSVRRSTSFRVLLEAVFRRNRYHCGKVIERIGKIARFFRIAVNFVQVATRANPGSKLFKVEIVPSRSRQLSVFKGRTVVDTRKRVPVLSDKLSRNSAEIRRLLQRWRKYVVHAEMLLLLFYEEHSEITLATNYIGISKRSCYLCANFIHLHGFFAVEGQHQQLYCLWTLPEKVNFASQEHKTKFLQALRELQHLLREKVGGLSAYSFQSLPMLVESVANFSRVTLLARKHSLEVLHEVTDAVEGTVASHFLQKPFKDKVNTAKAQEELNAHVEHSGQAEAGHADARTHPGGEINDEGLIDTTTQEASNAQQKPPSETVPQAIEVGPNCEAAATIKSSLENLKKRERRHRRHSNRSSRATVRNKTSNSTKPENPRPQRRKRRHLRTPRQPRLKQSKVLSQPEGSHKVILREKEEYIGTGCSSLLRSCLRVLLKMFVVRK